MIFAYGNTNYNDYGNGPEGWYGMREWKNRMFILLMKIPIIRAKFSQRFEVYYQDVLPVMEELIPTLYHSISGMAERNFERWPILDTYIWPNPQEMVDLHTHELQVEFVLNYLQVRSNWLKMQWKDHHILMDSFRIKNYSSI